jgi:hypothetical protein
MNDRRRLARKYLIIYSRVFDRDSGRVVGNLCDLSLGGAMLITEIPQKIDTRLRLHFDLPEADRFGVSHLDLEVRVAHCEADISPEFYNLGVEFHDLTDEQQRLVALMMEIYEFNREAGNYPVHPSAS